MELDFAREAVSTERIGGALADDPNVRIPKVYRKLSSSRLLVLEFLDGIPLTDLPRIKATGLDLHAFAERIAKLYAKMIFEVGFFHGDPHPGNLLVLPNGVIGLLDFGLAKELPPTFAQSMASMIVKSFMGDTQGSLAAARELGFNIDELTPELLKEVIASTGQGVREVRRAEVTGEGVGAQSRERRESGRIRTPVDRKRLGKLVAGGEKLKIPPHFALVGRTMMLLDGLSHMLAPGEHLVQRTMREALTPYALRSAT
jgi:ubiquinone biosynthesis protein